MQCHLGSGFCRVCLLSGFRAQVQPLALGVNNEHTDFAPEISPRSQAFLLTQGRLKKHLHAYKYFCVIMDEVLG